MKIALMLCKKAADRCTGIGCFRSAKECSGGFSSHSPQDPADIMAFFHCGGCEAGSGDGEILAKRFEQLRKGDLKVIHLASCMKKCERLIEIKKAVEENDFTCEVGSH